MFVIVGPGATAATRMPEGPYREAPLLVGPATACFDAVYLEAMLALDQVAGRIRASVEPPDVLIVISMLRLYLPRADARTDVARGARAISRTALVANEGALAPTLPPERT